MEIPHDLLLTSLKLLSLIPQIGVPDTMDFLYPESGFLITYFVYPSYQVINVF